MATDTSSLSTQKRFEGNPLWKPWMADYRLRQITSIDELEDYFSDFEGHPVLAWDVETRSLDPDPKNIVGHCFSYNEHEAVYVPVAHKVDTKENLDPDAVWKLLLKYIQPPTILAVYNYKFEGEILKRSGLLRPSLNTVLRDGMIYVWLDDSNKKRFNLKGATQDILNIDMLRIEDVPGCVTGKGKTKVLDFSRTRPSEATLYAAADPLFTLILTNKLHLKLSEEQPFVLKLEHALLDPLMRMESTPTYIDRAFLRNIVKDLTRWSNQLAARIYDEAGYEFNLGSPAAVGEFLVKKGVQLPKTKSEKQVATGEDVIGKLAEKYPVCKLVLDWRSLEKEKGTYANVLLKSTSEETPYCCFKFTSVGAPTGRFSSGGVDEGETRYAAMNVQAVPAADAYQDALARLVKNPPISEMDGSLRQIGQISFLEENLVEAEGKSLDFLWDNESPDSGPGT